jgi:hypothetical protein
MQVFARALFRVDEHASDVRLHCKEREEFGCGEVHADGQRFAPVARQIEIQRRVERQVLERCALRAPIEVVGKRVSQRSTSSANLIALNLNEPVWIGIRQRTQEYTVHDTENRRVRADPKSQCEHDRQREPRTLPQHSNGPPPNHPHGHDPGLMSPAGSDTAPESNERPISAGHRVVGARRQVTWHQLAVHVPE